MTKDVYTSPLDLKKREKKTLGLLLPGLSLLHNLEHGNMCNVVPYVNTKQARGCGKKDGS